MTSKKNLVYVCILEFPQNHMVDEVYSSMEAAEKWQYRCEEIYKDMGKFYYIPFYVQDK